MKTQISYPLSMSLIITIYASKIPDAGIIMLISSQLLSEQKSC